MPLPTRPVVGLLYPGEMGTAVGRLLREQGLRVVTTLEGRSARTRERSREAGLVDLASLPNLVEEADLIVSLVHPNAALETAAQVAAARRATGTPRPGVYLDLNSVSPTAAAAVCTQAEQVHLEGVDGALHGLAERLREMGTLYLSGPAATGVAPLFESSLRTRIVGERVGAASGFKMLLSGMSKGLSALFLEMGLLAAEAGVLDEILSEYRHYYPGLMEAVDRLLPTYPVHAARRGEEMAELAATARSLGMEPCVTAAAGELIRRMGELELDPAGRERWTAEAVIRRVHAENPLRERETEG